MSGVARHPTSRELAAIRAWYRPRRRAYPWRRAHPDPYAVLVSEVMLQQTQAPRVALVFERFLARFPDVRTLARASRPDVIRAWAGLGYNRRAVALHATAIAIEREHHGEVPGTVDALRTLPGVGPYTAGAVASIAFGAAVPAPDVNVRRVVARVLHGREPQDVAAGDLATAAAAFLDRKDPGGWNQALMDVGRELCRPSPRCEACPLRRGCRFRAAGRLGAPPAHPLGAPPTHPLGAPPGRRQAPFEGSARQVRGRIVAALRDRPSATLTTLVAAADVAEPRVLAAIDGLMRDGIVQRTGRGYRLHV
ncbi:MAG TPA: A/G-specific adenine glycosylase [Actinomycetota bacterium]|nr:A/G-specific adenine glycosylase [Actinomycetota bacterium]